MDKILESFPLGFLIRSAFSGVFFVISFAFAAPHFVKFDSSNFIKVGLPIALIAGVTVYCLHRSLSYPLIEWACNAKWAKWLRDHRLTLISRNSIENLAAIWDMKSEKGDDKKFQRGKQIATWADYTHLQYVSAWCIYLGGEIGKLASSFDCQHVCPLYFCCPFLRSIFFPSMAIFFIAAFVSNWRLFSVLQHMDKIVPITKD